MALSRRDIQFVRSLYQRKFRQKYNKFIVEGDKIAQEAIRSAPSQIDRVLALPEWWDECELQPVDQAYSCEVISERQLQQLSRLQSPNRALVVMHLKEAEWDPGVVRSRLCLYLDGIQDPGNAGTLLRIADWFGLPYVFASNDSADGYNPKVLQASMGAFLRVPYIRLEPDELFGEETEAFPLMGASLKGESIFERAFPSHGLLVIGREGSGIREALGHRLTHRLYIPGGGQAESLNAATATGIIVAQLLYGAGLGGRQA